MLILINENLKLNIPFKRFYIIFIQKLKVLFPRLIVLIYILGLTFWEQVQYPLNDFLNLSFI